MVVYTVRGTCLRIISAREDGTESDLPGPAYPSPATVRRQLKLTQTDIAALAGVPVATWRNWEQGRVSLDPAVRTLLRVLWREPDAVWRATIARYSPEHNSRLLFACNSKGTVL